MPEVIRMKSKLQKAFQRGLNLASDTDFSSLEFAKSKGWDSIAHLQLVAAIEQEFGILIETNDMLTMSSYLKAIEIVNKYIGIDYGF